MLKHIILSRINTSMIYKGQINVFKIVIYEIYLFFSKCIFNNQHHRQILERKISRNVPVYFVEHVVRYMVI